VKTLDVRTANANVLRCLITLRLIVVPMTLPMAPLALSYAKMGTRPQQTPKLTHAQQLTILEMLATPVVPFHAPKTSVRVSMELLLLALTAHRREP
jgi:hypothetical protein